MQWRALDNLGIGGAVFPTGGRWHVISDEGAPSSTNVARAWRGTVTADSSPRRSLRVSVHAGVEFARHYEFEADTGAPVDRDPR